MISLILRSLRAHRSRLTLTVVAVTAAVSFVTASFVLADSLRSVFGDLSDNIYDSVDAEIRAGEGTFDSIASGDRFAQTDLDGIAAIDGVASVTPSLGGSNVVLVVGDDGEVVRQTGPPTLVFSMVGDPATSPFTVASGDTPGPGQVMLDTAQADTIGATVGDPVEVAGPAGRETFTLSGTVRFGDSGAGAVSPYFILFDLPTTQRLLDAPDQLDAASVVFDDGVTFEEVRPAVEAALPAGLVLVDQATLVAEQNSQFGGVIDLLGTALLVFAGITLFVSTFVIANTFAVIVGQDRRQIGLLRAVGARRGQATTLVVAEAGVVGLIASLLGLAGGAGLAAGITAIVESVSNGGFPDGPTQLLPRTVIAALVVGVGVTVVAALLPARRAGSVAPLVAMRSDADTGEVTGESGRVAVLAHRALGATLGRLGPAGQVAATGVARNPRRVLSTSMSMIVGLALIAAMAVLASSYGGTVREAASGGVDGDVVITEEDGGPVPYAAIDELLARPEVSAASGYGITEVLHDGEVTRIAGFQSAAADGVVVFDPVEGTAGPLSTGEAYVSDDYAEANGVGVGDTTLVEFSDGFVADLTIRAVVDRSPLVDAPVMVDAALVAAHARNTDAGIAVARFTGGVSGADGMAAVTAALAEQPQLVVDTVADYVADLEADAQQLLTVANGLLALTIAVALTGIANTVALSLLERRSELGLLRAVGMSRRQLRRMVRYEAFTLSTFGAVIGVLVGVGIALAAIPLLPDTLVGTREIPFRSLAVYTAICIGFGVLAATIPARRASRLNVLDAIADPT
ncbi:MAG: FtsX-like permease family protein [Acidimicrobiales bacterium]